MTNNWKIFDNWYNFNFDAVILFKSMGHKITIEVKVL